MPKRPKCSVYIATSLDGFIARPDGDIEWLNQANAAVPKGEDCGFHDFFDSVDALIMGRNTFETVLGFNCPWPYGAIPVIVLSSRPLAIPDELQNTVSHSTLPPEELLSHLAAKGHQHLYIDGGLTIQNFLRAGLIDEITITTIPILLGTGIPLFSPLESDLPLKLLNTQAYPFGFTQSHYQVLYPTP